MLKLITTAFLVFGGLTLPAYSQVYLCRVNGVVCGASANPQPGDSRFDRTPTAADDPSYQAWLSAPLPPAPISAAALAAVLVAKGVLSPADIAPTNTKMP